MTLFSALNVSMAGLQAATSQMQIVSDNISNSGTAGYTRKTAVLETLVQGSSSSVRVVGYTRATDNVSTKALLIATSDNGKLGTSEGYLSQVESILGATNTSSTTSLADYITSFASAWTGMEAQPESSTTQMAVINAGVNLANAVQSVANQTEELYRSIKSDVSTTVNTLNADLQKVYSLNKQIVSATAAGASTGDLQDTRDTIVKEIASMTKITLMPHNDGSVSIYTREGYQLVDATPQTFSYNGTNLINTADPTVSLNGTLTGGSLQSSLSFVDTSATAAASTDAGTGVIAKLRSALDTIASAFTTNSAGPPQTFANAYGGTFFTGTNRTNFAVDTGLVDGSTTLTTTTVKATADTFNDSTKTFTTTAQTLTNTSYQGLATGVLSYFQQAANSVSGLAATTSSQKSYLETKIANNTGVSTDTELVNLTALESAYNASAKVISVIKAMLDALENAV